MFLGNHHVQISGLQHEKNNFSSPSSPPSFLLSILVQKVVMTTMDMSEAKNVFY